MPDDLGQFGYGTKGDPRFQSGVGGAPAKLVPKIIQGVAEELSSILRSVFPKKVGFCLFIFDYEKGGGMSYVANADREDMYKAIKEWLRKEGQL